VRHRNCCQHPGYGSARLFRIVISIVPLSFLSVSTLTNTLFPKNRCGYGAGIHKSLCKNNRRVMVFQQPVRKRQRIFRFRNESDAFQKFQQITSSAAADFHFAAIVHHYMITSLRDKRLQMADIDEMGIMHPEEVVWSKHFVKVLECF
jgi:hypothetical protein